jgi:hypothetical protein
MRQGFTLIELLLYIGLTAIILTASLSLAWTVLSSQMKLTAVNEINYNYRFLSNFLHQEIQNAKAINITQSVLDANPGRLVITNQDDSTTSIETENKSLNLNGQTFTLTNLIVTLPNSQPTNLITSKINITDFIVHYSPTTKQITTDIRLDYYNPSQDKRYEANKSWTQVTTIKSE